MKSFLSLTVASLLGFASGAEVTAEGKCLALAFSSGDENAAYQAGAMKGLVTSNMTQSDYAYDAVSGISGGALNAVILANYTKGNEGFAADAMEKFWKDAANTKLYKSWFGGITRGLFWEGGLYNSAPLENFLKKEFSDVAMHRKLDIGIVDVQTGQYRDFGDENITAPGTVADALYASMSFAGFFPPADVLGSYYFDGSAVWDIDIFSAINRCTAKGFKNEDIIVDVIMTSSANLKDVQAEDYKSIQMLFRYLEISSFYNAMDGLLRAQFAYEGVNFRCIVTPSGSVPSSLYPLNMDESQIDQAFAMGVKDAQDAVGNLEQGEACKNSVQHITHYHALKKSGDQRMKKHTFGSFVEAKKNGEFEEYNIKEDPYAKKYSIPFMQ